MNAPELKAMFRLEQTFTPYASQRREKMREQGRLFVHYTSAENAINIIQSKQIWMRNAKCMTDYMEILHGHQLLVQFFSQEKKRNKFYSALNACHDGIGEEAIKLFDQWWANIQFNTYICCISEHEKNENQHGRLSMWRAFGRLPARAALYSNYHLQAMLRGCTLH